MISFAYVSLTVFTRSACRMPCAIALYAISSGQCLRILGVAVGHAFGAGGGELRRRLSALGHARIDPEVNREAAIEIAAQGEIMDRVHATSGRPRMRRLRIETGQHERRMPVLRVYDIGLESEVRCAGKQRVAVEEESVLVIVTSIDVRAPEIALVLEQIDRDASHVRLPDIDSLSALRPRHADVREHVPQVERGALDRAVHR